MQGAKLVSVSTLKKYNKICYSHGLKKKMNEIHIIVTSSNKMCFYLEKKHPKTQIILLNWSVESSISRQLGQSIRSSLGKKLGLEHDATFGFSLGRSFWKN